MPKTIRGLQVVAVVLFLCTTIVGWFAWHRGLVLVAVVDAILIVSQISLFIFLERLRRRSVQLEMRRLFLDASIRQKEGAAG